ncbi:hypothetical protein TSUD_284260 [Trifolium subterraneum]|uniref:Uncharacterized protein n=1 Tax=Trifolium subterraneum TaxID=3900 RepID=A0A2Z6PLX3_TRISU|nr:hypothetical protein TSUD_284260 [Trifolium subterraneum]
MDQYKPRLRGIVGWGDASILIGVFGAGFYPGQFDEQYNISPQTHKHGRGDTKAMMRPIEQ